MKRILRIFVSLVMSIMMCFVTSCKKQELYNEMSLENAYSLGYLTQEDLKSIAYYYNAETAEPTFELIPKVELNKSIEEKIKLSYLQRSYIKDTYPKATANDIRRFDYYGTYNGCAVVFIIDSLFAYDFVFEAEYTIDGVTFYNYCALSVYQINI